MCFRPKNVYLYFNEKTKKQLIKFRDFGFFCYGSDPNDGLYKFQSNISIGCGHCAECAMQKSRDWTTRIILENYYSKDSYFFTLTYNDQNYTKSLLKSDLKEFIKKVRNYYYKHFKIDGIRYYAIGEYGSKSARAHYHILFFNLPIKKSMDKDITFKKVSKSINGDYIFEVPLFDKLWNKGFVSIGSVNKQSIGYVSRYCNKKKLSYMTTEDYAKLDLIPEFSLMSKKPGIGFQYVEDHFEEILKNNFKVYVDGQAYVLDRSTIRKFLPELSDRNKVKYFSRVAGVASERYNFVNNITNEQRERLYLEKIKSLKRSI